MVNTEKQADGDLARSSLADLIESERDIAPLVAAIADSPTSPTSAGPGAAEAHPVWQESVPLALGDLLPDAAGEVVLLGGDDIPFSIYAAEPVTAAGIAEAHVTAGGLDVTGLHFYSFENGITLYSPTDLIIDGGHGGA